MRRSEMHTTSLGNGWLANHNVDYCGEVTFTKLPDIEVTLPTAVVLAFAAEIVRSKEIEQIERMDVNGLLGIDVEDIFEGSGQ
jgi:hypothetical protein